MFVCVRDRERGRGVVLFQAQSPHVRVSDGAQDYRVHIKHTDGRFEYIPYFSLPANDLNDVIAPSCYSCFDYPNALADLVGLCFHSLQMPIFLCILDVQGLVASGNISGRQHWA